MFEDLKDVVDPRLPLRVDGRLYHVPEPTAFEGLRLQAIFADPEVHLTDDMERTEILKILGPVYDEMRSYGVPWSRIMLAGRTALIHHAMSPSKARQYALGGDDPGNPLPPKPRRRWLRGSASVRTNATGT